LSKLLTDHDCLMEIFKRCSRAEACMLFIELIEKDIDFKLLKSTLLFVDINYGDHPYRYPINPLIYAWHHGKFELAKFLIENGANVNKLLSYYQNEHIERVKPLDNSHYFFDALMKDQTILELVNDLIAKKKRRSKL